MAFRHLGGSPKKALAGEMLLVVRKWPYSFPMIWLGQQFRNSSATQIK